MSIVSMTLTELSEAMKRGELSSREITQAYLDRIHEVEDKVGGYITVDEEGALEQAEKADRARASGERLSPLHGIPVAVKDNICVEGLPATCASRMLENFVPPYSATAWEKLRAAGCVLLGKTNLDEFAMGSTTENSAFHPTRNPRDLTRVPGGSSGGSAAVVAAEEAPFSLGSDTGGSIRQPAAFCGVVGMKPTYGMVSRYGLIAFASSLDQIGPMTKTVADNALVLDAIAGYDRRDTTSVKRGYTPMNRELRAGVKGLRVGLPKEMFAEGLSADVRKAVMRAARKLEELGATVVEVSLPSLQYALPAYYVLSSAEASSNLARFDGVRYGHRAAEYADLEELYVRSRSEGFGAEVKRRILLGTYTLSAGYFDAYYKKALQVRTLVIRDFNSVFETCDCLLGPVAPTTAYKLGEKTMSPLEMYLGDIHTVPVNIAGIPALSMPCGVDRDGLPVGLQLMGATFSEPTLYRVGQALEEAMEVRQ
ncbi:MAG: Asp-tRNA(Asn)/Glu-tRNA(Gln) amidotransferase subunit GatA [Christensenellaceae bacterium]|nr:Asp-tRNA(Asn)/Glu-tRNA(Gln) amidotransferase subunit GatA [Christensenellaceae bacterium]